MKICGKEVPVLESITLVIFSIFSFILNYRHEAWADEAQAWLIARDSPSILSMMKLAPYEGSPMLWHVILYIFAHLGLSIQSMKIFHMICSIITAALILFVSPFKRYQKVMAIFGYYLFYEYNIIARSYGLTVMLLAILAVIYKKRDTHQLQFALVSALIIQTNVHGLVFGLTIFGTFMLERIIKDELQWRDFTRTHLSLFIFIISAGIAVFVLLPPKDLPEFLVDWNSNHTYAPVGFSLFFNMRGLFPIHTLGKDYWSYNLTISIFNWFEGRLVGLLFLIIAVYQFSKKPYTWTILFPSWIGLDIIFVYKRGICPRHCGLVYVIYFFVYWFSFYYTDISYTKMWKRLQKKFTFLSDMSLFKLSTQGEGKRGEHGDSMIKRFLKGVNKYNLRSLLFTLILLIQLVSTPVPVYHDYHEDFSNAQDVATYLEEEGYSNDETLLAAYTWFPTMSILPHFNNHTEFYFIEQDQYGSYVKWDKKFFNSIPMTTVEIINTTLSEGTAYKEIILILSFDASRIQNSSLFLQNFQLLQAFENAIIGNENFWVYQAT